MENIILRIRNFINCKKNLLLTISSVLIVFSIIYTVLSIMENSYELNFSDKVNPLKILNNKGLELSKEGKYDEALKCFDKIIEKEPKNIEAYLNKGWLCYNQHKYEEASKCYNKIIEIDPDSETCIPVVKPISPPSYSDTYNKGIALFYQSTFPDKNEETIKYFDKVIEIAPEFPYAWLNKARTIYYGRKDWYFKRKTYKKANDNLLIYLDRFLEINPDVWFFYWKGELLFYDYYDYQEGIKFFNKCLAFPPLDGFGYKVKEELKEAEIFLRDREKQINELRKSAIELNFNPDKGKSWYSKGELIMEICPSNPDKEEALKCYDKAISLEPNYWEAWYKKGQILHSLGRYDEGSKCYDKALNLDPNNKDILYDKAGLLYCQYKYDEAVKYCDRLLKLAPKDPFSWYLKAWLLSYQSKYNEAIDCCNKATGFIPPKNTLWLSDSELLKEAIKSRLNSKKRQNKVNIRKFTPLAPGKKLEEEKYILYIPSNIDPAQRYPLVIAFSPGGDANGMINMWKNISEKYKFIIVASKEYNNGVMCYLAPLSDMADILRSDIFINFPADKTRVLATGISGGGTAAFNFLNIYPDLVSAIIVNTSYMCWLSPIEAWPLGKKAVFLASPGDQDYYEMEERYISLAGLGWNLTWLEFEGGHSTAPESVYEQAILWLKEQNF